MATLCLKSNQLKVKTMTINIKKTLMLDEGLQYKDDPKAEYHNADGTAKSTTYLVTAVAEMPGGKLECAVQIAYYAENDLDAYDRSAGVIRRSLLGRSRKQDEIVTTRFQYFVAKPNRVDPDDGETIFRHICRAKLPWIVMEVA